MCPTPMPLQRRICRQAVVTMTNHKPDPGRDRAWQLRWMAYQDAGWVLVWRALPRVGRGIESRLRGPRWVV
jgi:hypothetical protein